MITGENPLFWLLAIIGVLLTGISKSGFAGGAGVVAVPLLSLVMPVPQAVVLMLPLLLVMDAKTVTLYRQAVKFRNLGKIAGSALLGIAAAGFALQHFSSAGLQLLLAIFCLLFASWHQLLGQLARLPGSAFLWGSLSGVSSTLLHAGGPPISIYFMAQGIAKRQWLAQAAVFFAFMNLVKIIPYSFTGLWSADVIVFSLLMLPIAWLGVLVGHKLQNHLSEHSFSRVCRYLLAVSGLGLIIKLY
jgi:hypothetical protein